MREYINYRGNGKYFRKHVYFLVWQVDIHNMNIVFKLLFIDRLPESSQIRCILKENEKEGLTVTAPLRMNIPDKF